MWDPNGAALPEPDAVRSFRLIFENGGGQPIAEHLCENAELRPPTYGKSWTGRDLVWRLVCFAAESFGGLRYTHCLEQAGLHVLRFEGAIAGEAISGVDLVSLDEHGKITCIEIFARPPRAITALREAMGQRVRADPIVAALMGLA